MSNARRVVLVSALISSVGCARSPREFEAERSRLLCELLVCAFGGDPDVNCAGDYSGTARLTDDSVAAGRMGFDADKARACLAASAIAVDALCSGNIHPAYPAGTTTAACDLALVPLVADGETCTGDIECLSGLCTIPANSCGGTCAATLNVNDTGCDRSTRDCARDAWCDHPFGAGANEGTCKARVDVGGACTSDSMCHLGLLCVKGKCSANDATQGTTAVGGDCTEDLDCAGDAACLNAKCAERKASGATCSSGSFGGPVSECAGYATCDGVSLFGGEGKCLVLKSAGEACTRGGEGDDDCRAGLECKADTNTCAVTVVTGRACDEEETCPSTHRCSAGKCVEAPGEGDACDSVLTCGSGYSCDDGKCTLAVCDV